MRYYNYLGEEELDRLGPKKAKERHPTEFPEDMDRHELFNWVWREYKNLWHSIIEKYSNVGEYKDRSQIAALVIYRSLELFDRERQVTFTAYCYKCIAHEFNAVFRAGKAKKRCAYKKVNIPDLEKEFDEYDLTLYNTRIQEVQVVDEVDRRENCRIVASIICKTLTAEELFILRNISDGAPQQELAARLGYCQANISTKFRAAQDKLRDNPILLQIFASM